MADRLEQLKRQLDDWLRRNELDGDLDFWTPSEWQARGEDYLNEAKLVITTEGQLHFLLNYAFDDPKIDELQDLLSSFGFWFEMGHSWNIGIYEDAGYDEQPVPAAYHDKLQDKRWKAKADFVKKKAGHGCQDCGNTTRPLDVHHCWYRYGFEPWQYPLDALRCVCRDCHQRRQTEDHDFRCLNAEFTWRELASIRTCLKKLFYWYDRSAALAFVEAVGSDGLKMRQALEELLKKKTEPGAT